MMKSAFRLATRARAVQQPPQRHMAKAATAATTPWADQKAAAKERRRALYDYQQERKQRLVTRRVHAPKGEKRRAFRSWFIPQKVNDEYHQRKARQAGLDWKLQVSVVLERNNVVLPDLEEWEKEYEQLTGYLMQFGKDYPKALFPLDDIVPMEEAVASEEELYEILAKQGFTPAPRETPADASGDVRTTDRKLKTEIFLTVQQEKGVWQLPTVELNDGETFVQAARRAIPEIAGDQVEFWCPSNCPCAVGLKPFSEPKDGYYGVKTFFMKVQYDEGAVSDSNIADFAWLDRAEVEERMAQQDGEEAAKFYRYLL